uniref:Uncharacterized protein n=1 Tax=Arundo donax TaxID=35708 RepID=A0A0A9FYC8_ARUDO
MCPAALQVRGLSHVPFINWY